MSRSDKSRQTPVFVMQQVVAQAPFNIRPPISRPNYSGTGNVKAVIFDLFDTLLLTGGDHNCYVKALAKMHYALSAGGFNYTYSEFEAAYMKVAQQIETQTAASLKEPHFKTYIQETLKTFEHDIAENEAIIEALSRIFCREFNRHIQIDPQAVRVLKALKRRYRVGLVSNLSFPESAWELLRIHKLEDFFDFTVVSGDVNLRKPHPKIFNLALDELRVDASEAVFVGDTPETDIAGALKVGMIPVLINRRNVHVPGCLRGKTFTINALEELGVVLGELEQARL